MPQHTTHNTTPHTQHTAQQLNSDGAVRSGGSEHCGHLLQHNTTTHNTTPHTQLTAQQRWSGVKWREWTLWTSSTRRATPLWWLRWYKGWRWVGVVLGCVMCCVLCVVCCVLCVVLWLWLWHCSLLLVVVLVAAHATNNNNTHHTHKKQ